MVGYFSLFLVQEGVNGGCTCEYTTCICWFDVICIEIAPDVHQMSSFVKAHDMLDNLGTVVYTVYISLT